MIDLFFQVMFLRNHGLVILGETIEEAFGRACATVQACEAQVRMMPVGIDNLILISDEAKSRSNVIDIFFLFLITFYERLCFFFVISGSGQKIR